MTELRYTLLADGGSDKVLIPIINWVFDRYHPEVTYRSQFPGGLRTNSMALIERAREALRLCPCDILFVHRDAERKSFDFRKEEICRELGEIGMPFVPVVPVRMTEAWLLSDERAIRRAANNASGTNELNLPAPRTLDNLPDPKDVLFSALRTASGLSGRRRATLSVERARHRVAELTNDFSALEVLPAFSSLRVAIADVAMRYVPDEP